MPPPVDGPRDEIPADDVERGRPAADPDPVAAAQRLEPLVVTDRMAVVLGEMVLQVDPQSRQLKARQTPVVLDGLIADVAARKF
jgi:hypothetical protein